MNVLWLMLLLPAGQESGGNHLALMLKANYAMVIGDYPTALELVQRVVSADPQSADAAFLHLEILDAYQKSRLVPSLEHRREVVAALQTYISRFPEDYRLPLMMGDMLIDQPGLSTAFELAAPDHYLDQALLLMERHQVEAAERANALYLLGRCYFLEDRYLDASDAFLEALEGLVEPEAKRRRIGDTFIAVFQEEAERLGISHHLLGQGTIYPDTIETGGTKRADTIKTHHNRVPIIEEMLAQGKVVEPLAELYKVEVRELGERLGIAREALWRHPFPGPGLGVRVLCGLGIPDEEGFDVLAPAAAALAAEYGLRSLPLPIRSVGVKADLRAYEHPVLLSGDVPWDRLIKAVSDITAKVPGVNRCVWNLGEGHPTSARPVAGTMTRARLDLLREADHMVMEALRESGLYDQVWQCPTVLLPVALGDGDGETVVVRPVRSQRAMTATPVAFPPEVLDRLRAGILGLPGVCGLLLDVTSKPPGTIEWE